MNNPRGRKRIPIFDKIYILQKFIFYRFSKQLEGSEKTGARRGLLSGIGGGVMWFIIYCCYSLAFWYGVALILESREERNFEYTPAVLIIVSFIDSQISNVEIFSVVLISFEIISNYMKHPHFKAI